MIADDMRELVTLFQHSDLQELSIEQRGRKLFLRKGEQVQGEVSSEELAAEQPRTAEVKAHMVGVFFWNKEKSGKPAVALHQAVDKGHVVGYIEALGIFNEVEAPDAGTIAEIDVAAGQPVEYGQRLLVLEPQA